MVLHVYFVQNTQFCDFVSDTFYLELMALKFHKTPEMIVNCLQILFKLNILNFFCVSCNCLVYVTFFFAYDLFTNSVSYYHML